MMSLLIILATSNPGASSARVQASADSWRVAKQCGVNCLYAYLRLWGKPTSLNTLRIEVPAGDYGTSFDRLRRAASSRDVPSEIRRIRSTELTHIEMPAIAHLSTGNGHYVLLLKADENSVTVCDMTTGHIESMPYKKYDRLATGYVMLRSQRLMERVLLTSAVGLMILAVISIGIIAAHHQFVSGLLLVSSVVICLVSFFVPTHALDDSNFTATHLNASPQTSILRSPVRILNHASMIPRDTVTTRESIQDFSQLFELDEVVPDLSTLLHYFATPRGENDGMLLLDEFLAGRHSDRLHSVRSFLTRDQYGVRVKLMSLNEPWGEKHPGQFLALLASFGIETDRLVRSGDSAATVAELVHSLRSDFTLAGEIEWSVMALARYAPTADKWLNRWGQVLSFDEIALELVERPFGFGSCSGTHTLEALAILRHVAKTWPLLSSTILTRVENRLEEASRTLEASQRASGYWAPDWPNALATPAISQYDERLYGRHSLALVTGYHMEWQRFVDNRIGMNQVAILCALRACSSFLERTSHAAVKENYCAYSHCFRAVMRMRENLSMEQKQ